MIGLHLITVDDDAVIVSVMEWSGVEYYHHGVGRCCDR